MNRKEFEHLISSKAAEDPAFRKALLADPKGVISKALGQVRDGAGIPDHVQVQIVEESPDKIYFVIPAAGSSELSEEQLAGVAGGGGVTPTTVQTVVPILDGGVAVINSGNYPPMVVVAVVA